MKKTKVIHTPVGPIRNHARDLRARMAFVGRAVSNGVKSGEQRDSGPRRVQYQKPSQKASSKARFGLPRKNP